MRIGEDFDKIEFEWLGLDLLEPNAFIGDTLLFLLAIFFAFKVSKLNRSEDFFKHWQRFYVIFGISFLLGGFGHLLYNYWEIPGKTPSWYLGIIAAYFIERAMISIHPKTSFKSLFNKLSAVKLALALLAALGVSIFVDLAADYTQGMKVPTINSTIGMLFALGFLGILYTKTINSSFKYFWIGFLTLIPAAITQSIKLNIHQWFDKNDLGHVLLMISLCFYYAGIKGYAKYLQNKG